MTRTRPSPTPAAGVHALLVTALRVELRALVKRLGLHPDGDGRFVSTDGRTLAACVGPGRTAGEHAAALLNTCHPRRVIVAGYAGGLTPGLGVAALVEPTRLVDAATGHAIGETHPDPERTLVTAAEPVCTPEAKRALGDRWQAAAVDMESYHVASACRAADVPWRVVRAVTDAADHRVDPAVMTLIDERGAASPRKLIEVLLSRPWLIPSLCRLARRTARADRALAEAVREALDALPP